MRHTAENRLFFCLLQARGSHRTATVPTYDDLVEYEALLQIIYRVVIKELK